MGIFLIVCLDEVQKREWEIGFEIWQQLNINNRQIFYYTWMMEAKLSW